MPRRARNLYELVEADELTADEAPAPTEAPEPADKRPHQRSPRIGAGIALICALVVVGVLVGHLRHGGGLHGAPTQAAAEQRTVVVRHETPHRSRAVRRRAHLRPAVHHVHLRHRRTGHQPETLVAPPRSTVVASATLPPARRVRSTRPSAPARARLTPAEMEFGIEH